MKIPCLITLIFLFGAAEAIAQGRRRGPSQTGTAAGTEIGAKYRYWKATMEGDAESDENGVSGTKIDLDGVQDIDEDEILHDFSLWGNLPGIGIARINYWQGTFEGSSTVSSDFTWSGTLYPSGTAITSKWDVEAFSAMWDYPLFTEQLGSGYFNGAAQVGYDYHFLKARIDGAGGLSGSDTISAATISVGFHGFSQLASWLYADIEFRYGIFDLNKDVDVTSLEYTIDLQINPLETLFLGVGYRRIELEVGDERSGGTSEFDFDGKIDGLFASVSYHF